jgi:hypothetical protein
LADFEAVPCRQLKTSIRFSEVLGVARFGRTKVKIAIYTANLLKSMS